ncbi:MAG: hypothetical protein AAFO73_07600 [Pseudomonadota bacterium]
MNQRVDNCTSKAGSIVKVKPMQTNRSLPAAMMGVVLSATVTLTVPQADASEPAPKAPVQKKVETFVPEKFALVTTQNGVVRINRKTGTVTFCQQRAGALRCHLAADERAAWLADMEAMGARIEALEARIATLETQPKPSTQAPVESEGFLSKKTRDDMENMLTAAEKVVRRFASTVKEWTRDAPTDN